MHNFLAIHELILKELKKLCTDENFYFKPVKPKPSDLELIKINLVIEYRGIDSEYQLFRDLKYTELATKIERSVYNKRKRKLFFYIEEIRKKMVDIIDFFLYFFSSL